MLQNLSLTSCCYVNFLPGALWGWRLRDISLVECGLQSIPAELSNVAGACPGQPLTPETRAAAVILDPGLALQHVLMPGSITIVQATPSLLNTQEQWLRLGCCVAPARAIVEIGWAAFVL